MKLPFFRTRPESQAIRLPVPEMAMMHFGAYFHAGDTLPDAEELAAMARAWIDRHAPGPIHGPLRLFMDQGLLALRVDERAAMPAPPEEDLRHLSDEAAAARLSGTTHVAVIEAPDALFTPRVGLWCALAAARGIAAAMDGVVFDPSRIRLLPLNELDEDIPPDGRITMTEHILVPYSVDERGAGWVTTMGMPKFGLPNLEIRHAPPAILTRLGHVMNGVAQRLAEAVMAAAEERAPEVVLERELRLGLDAIARAEGADAGAAPSPVEGVRGWTIIGLEYTGRGRRNLESFISLVPPGGAKLDPGEWLYGVLNDLLGPEDPENCDYIPGDNERMEEAHHRAVAEVPDVKRRFLAGLPPGEQLYVKYGFPIEDHHEFMWISVATWKGTRIHGRLANDPFERLDLRAGQSVDVAESDVFDWMIEGPDDTIEGNYTGRVAREEGLWDG